MDALEDGLSDGLSTIAEFVPKLVLFLIILIVGIIVAKLIGKALSALLERVGFDRAVERGGVKRALENSKMDASDIIAKLVYYTLMLFVLQLAFGVFGPNPISDLLTQVITFLPSIIVAIIIVVVASSIAAAVKVLIEGTLGGLSYGKVVANAASVFILFLGVVAALNQVGVATTVTLPVLIAILAAVVGVIVVGVGGGLVKPMQQRWEGYLSNAEEEAPRIKEHAAKAPSVREQARQATDRAREYTQDDSPTTGATSYDPAAYGAQPVDGTRQY
ncbi:mechanosensitive ion channel family protein [Nocardioides sp. LHG3406-4]|uniref:mechanosensitive ion channel family protein n=1 Tax=Nocardioides sp. LHG3406-4 TaxID=2804575 RepID=UPI003CF24C23